MNDSLGERGSSSAIRKMGDNRIPEYLTGLGVMAPMRKNIGTSDTRWPSLQEHFQR